MTDSITNRMHTLLAYTRQLGYLIAIGVEETVVEGPEVETRFVRRAMTPNTVMLLEQDRDRVMRYIYDWQRKSGQRITGKAHHQGRRKPVACAPCVFNVQEFGQLMRA